MRHDSNSDESKRRQIYAFTYTYVGGGWGAPGPQSRKKSEISMKKPLEKPKKPLEKPKKPLENPKSCWKNFFLLKPLNLAADSRYPPPPTPGGWVVYPRWVGGLRPLIQKMGIGVGKSVNLPPLDDNPIF